MCSIFCKKRPRCSEETTPSSLREATARARGPTRGDDGAAPLYAALQLVDGSHGSSAGYHSFGTSEGRCCSPRARPSRRPPMSSPPRPLPQPRARHHVASRARRPPHLAGCGVARARPPALAAMPTRLAEPSAALLALPGRRAAARLTEPAAAPPARARRRWLPCHRALPSCPGRCPCSLATAPPRRDGRGTTRAR